MIVVDQVEALFDRALKKRVKPIEHIIVEMDGEGNFNPILKLEHNKSRAAHNYPKGGEALILSKKLYFIKQVVHDYDARQIRYYAEFKENLL